MSWLANLKSGLSNTSGKIGSGISELLLNKKLDQATLDKLEELLITADLGVETAAEVIAPLAEKKFGREVSPLEVKQAFVEEIAKILQPVAKGLKIDSTKKPYVVMVVGVNGNGKTTSVGKLAHLLKNEGHKVQIAAADTFRAAAVEQLKTWGTRAGAAVYEGTPGQDPASVAYQALVKARDDQADVLLIDTAGRLQNKANLMGELLKIKNVCAKITSEAPHEIILVLDATTGQNAISQVEEFQGKTGLTGLIVTKLDGTAKGGIVVALASKFKLPVYALGIGEGVDDMKPFRAEDFARNLLGIG